MANTGNTQQQINYGAAVNDGTGDPLRTAFIKTDENFDNIWLAGPVGSNITITNNTIQVNNTNGNLVLSPNGVGVVQTNSRVVPRLNNTYDLGSTTLKYRTGYFGAGGLAVDGNVSVVENLTAGGDLAVAGNLVVEGDVIQIGNIITDSKTIQLANTAATDAQANGSGITVGANDDVATLLYNSNDNEWRTNIGANIAGNVTADYFVGNGSLLTGITSYGNSNVAAYLPTYGGNISAGNINIVSALAANAVITSGNVSVGGSILADGPIDSAGNIGGAYFFGNGYHLTGIVSSYGNANVVYLLSAFGSNTISTTGIISTTGNISGNFVAPGGNGQVMYNRNGVIGASPVNFNFDEGTDTLYVKVGSFSGAADGTDALYVGSPGYTFLGSDIMAQFTGNVDSYSQINFQNISNSATASGDYIITADNGTDTSNFLDLGMTSSGWDGSEINALNGLAPNNGYLYVQDGNLTLGTKLGSTSYTWNFDTAGNLTVPGNIIPNTSNAYSLGNATNQWQDLWVSNATIYMNSVPISLGAGNVLTVNGEALLSNDSTTTITTTGNITADYFFGNGSQLTGIISSYGNSNVADYLTTYTGNINGGNISVQGEVGANTINVVGEITSFANIVVAPGGYFQGNGSQLTGLPPGYTDSDAANLLASFGSNNISTTGNIDSGNITASYVYGDTTEANVFTGGSANISGNISASGNITGSYIFGNGSQLTGLPSSYSNSNVATFLAAYGSNTISTTGNITAGILNSSGSIYGNPDLILGNVANTSATRTRIVTDTTFSYIQTGNGAVGSTGNIVFSPYSSPTQRVVIDTSSGNLTATGNVTAQNFTGNISITGNITGTSANVTLIAGAYSATFDNTGNLTVPNFVQGTVLKSTNSSGNEGGEINLTASANATIDGVVIDSYNDIVRIFEDGGTSRGVYIDLTKAPSGVGGELQFKASGLVNAGVDVTLGNLRARIPTSGNRSLQISTVSGTYSIYGSSIYNAGGTVSGTNINDLSPLSVTTTPAYLNAVNNFGSGGDSGSWTIMDTTAGLAWRISFIIGASYNNNMISIERLV